MYRKDTFILFAVTLWLASGCCFQNHSERIEDLVKSTDAAIGRNDMAGAQRELKEAIKEAEKGNLTLQKPRLLIKLADIEAEEKDYDAAQSSLTEAISLYESNIPQKAMAVYRGDIAEEEVDALGKLGAVFKAEHKLPEAEVAYKKAWQKGRLIVGSLKSHEDAAKKYVEILRKEGKNVEAETVEIALAVEEPDDNLGQMIQRAETLVSTSQVIEGSKRLKVVTQLAKQRGHLKFWRESVLWQALIDYAYSNEKAMPGKVDEILNSAVHDQPQGARQAEVTAKTLLALADENSNRQKSEELFAEAKAIDKVDEREVVRLAACICVSLANYAEQRLQICPQSEKSATKRQFESLLLKADKNYERQFALTPNPTDLGELPRYREDLLGQAWVYRNRGKYDEAAACCRKILSLPGGKTPEIYANYIGFLILDGKDGEAKTMVKEAIEIFEKKKKSLGKKELHFLFIVMAHGRAIKADREAKILTELISTSPNLKDLSTSEKKEIARLHAQH